MTNITPEYKTYKIQKDGNEKYIKVVKEYDLIKGDYHNDIDILSYLFELSEAKFSEFKKNVKKGSVRIFKVLLEDDKRINEREKNWIEQQKNWIEQECKEVKDPAECANELKDDFEFRLKDDFEFRPQFNMDILVVNTNDVDDEDEKDDAFHAEIKALQQQAQQLLQLPQLPQQNIGGNRRRRNNKKSKRKSKNNRKKTNRRR
jgi:hypothetical protein